jgi:hypothetical protein
MIDVPLINAEKTQATTEKNNHLMPGICLLFDMTSNNKR